jgi:hypothetical protein
MANKHLGHEGKTTSVDVATVARRWTDNFPRSGERGYERNAETILPTSSHAVASVATVLRGPPMVASQSDSRRLNKRDWAATLAGANAQVILQVSGSRSRAAGSEDSVESETRAKVVQQGFSFPSLASQRPRWQ